jgi:hypothetical protein
MRRVFPDGLIFRELGEQRGGGKFPLAGLGMSPKRRLGKPFFFWNRATISSLLEHSFLKADTVDGKPFKNILKIRLLASLKFPISPTVKAPPAI